MAVRIVLTGGDDHVAIHKKRRETPWVIELNGDEAMAYAFDRIPQECVSDEKSGSARSLLRRLLDAILASQQRRADREIARYVIASGRFTDDTEREIERRFLFR